MRDPLDDQEDPYLRLGVGENGSLDEVNRAYAAILKDRARLSEWPAAARAKERLTRADTRVEEDLLHYPEGRLAPRNSMSFDYGVELLTLEIELLEVFRRMNPVPWDEPAQTNRKVEIPVLSSLERDFFACPLLELPL